jgi:hypothetical protein
VNGAKLGDGGGWADEKVGECAMVFQSIFSAGSCRVTCCELSRDFFQLAAVSIESYVTGRIGNGEVVVEREAQRNSFNYGCGRDKLFGGKFVAHVTAVAWQRGKFSGSCPGCVMPKVINVLRNLFTFDIKHSM